MGTPSYLTTSALARTLDLTETPFGFLKKLLFGSTASLAHEHIELSEISRGNMTAPFVRRGAEGVMTKGYEKRFDTVQAPYIRIKRPINPWEGMNERAPGMGLFPNEGELRAQRRAHVARELAGMEADIVNTEEWLCAMAIRGEISYSVDDQEHFTITYNKPVANETTAAASWGTTSTNPAPDFKQAKRLMSAANTGFPVTHCIMSPDAADKFQLLTPVRDQLDTKNLSVGTLTFQERFSDDGTLIYIGSYCGIPCWEYNAVLPVNGVDVPLIRTDYVEFVHASPRAENKMYYAAIADEDARDGLFVGKRFGKSWKEEDPSSRVILAASRPLPVMRRPGTIVSMDVS